MTPKEKQDSQACSSGPVVAFSLSFPSRHTPSGPGATCTSWGQDMAFLSLSRTQDPSSRTPSPCPYYSHSSLLRLHPKTLQLGPEHAARNGSCQRNHCGFHNLLLLQLYSLFALCANICGRMLCSCAYTCIYVSCYPPPKAQGNVRPVER